MATTVSGVYEIRHVESGKVYIGSSVNVRARWRQHRSDLRMGRHHSRRLQRSWNEHGASAFAFRVREEVGPADLFARENCHIEETRARPSPF
jgi:group I intron endonuclease